jgi:hypothetical protein
MSCSIAGVLRSSRPWSQGDGRNKATQGACCTHVEAEPSRLSSCLQEWPSNPELGAWVKRQRVARAAGQLSDDRLAILQVQKAAAFFLPLLVVV